MQRLRTDGFGNRPREITNIYNEKGRLIAAFFCDYLSIPIVICLNK
jgi:hypothetical protein